MEALSDRSRAQVVACLRGYFDELVRRGALTSNPAASVEHYTIKTKIGHYQALKPHEMGAFLDAIKPETLLDLQERAIIALMGYSCARVGAVTKMKQGDVYEEDGHLFVSLDEKGDHRHYVPCHPELEGYLREFLARSSKPSDDCDLNPAGWLFRRWDKKRKVLTGRPLSRLICYHMVKRRNGKVGPEPFIRCTDSCGATLAVSSRTRRVTVATKSSGIIQTAAQSRRPRPYANAAAHGGCKATAVCANACP